MARTTENTNALSLFDLMQLLEQAPNYWYTTAQVSTITNLSTSWLAAAREGLKEHPGPPYKKIGSGKSAPIRYRAGDLRSWMDYFQSQLNSSGARYTSHEDFMQRARPDERWLYAVNATTFERVPIHDAIACQTITPTTRLCWVSRRDSESSTWTLEVRLPVDILRKLPLTGKRGLNSRILAALEAYKP